MYLFHIVILQWIILVSNYSLPSPRLTFLSKRTQHSITHEGKILSTESPAVVDVETKLFTVDERHDKKILSQRSSLAVVDDVEIKNSTTDNREDKKVLTQAVETYPCCHEIEIIIGYRTKRMLNRIEYIDDSNNPRRGKYIYYGQNNGLFIWIHQDSQRYAIWSTSFQESSLGYSWGIGLQKHTGSDQFQIIGDGTGQCPDSEQNWSTFIYGNGCENNDFCIEEIGMLVNCSVAFRSQRGDQSGNDNTLTPVRTNAKENPRPELENPLPQSMPGSVLSKPVHSLPQSMPASMPSSNREKLNSQLTTSSKSALSQCKTDTNKQCVFPFKFGCDTSYTTCIRFNPNEPYWCSTMVDSNQRHIPRQDHWGNCVMDGKCEGRNVTLDCTDNNHNNNMQTKMTITSIDSSCGQEISTLGARIASGHDAKIETAPWVVQVHLKKIESQNDIKRAHCTGTIVDEYHVLTAKHCLGIWNGKKTLPPWMHDVYLRAQVYDCKQKGRIATLIENKEIITIKADIDRGYHAENDQRTVEKKVVKVYFPDHFSSDSDRIESDLMVLELKDKLEFKDSNRIRPVCLPDNHFKKMVQNFLEPSKKQNTNNARIVGYGIDKIRTQNQIHQAAQKGIKLVSNHLQDAWVPILYDSREKRTATIRTQVIENEQGIVDSCQADSGGGLFADFNLDGKNYQVLIGTLILGFAGCGQSKEYGTVSGVDSSTALYTNMVSYTDFIQCLINKRQR